MSDTDLALLARYTRHHAEDAFAEIVRRHLDLVHSAALRQVRSPQLAEEVAQSTFINLARHAHRLAPDTILTAWLYQVARREAIDVVRREARRQLREQIATEMNAMNATATDWTHIEPLLDEAMHALDDTDRTAVLLRYFENKSLREVGETLGTSDDTAQKRVSRAVERLRGFFAKRGVTVGASGLVVVISANAVAAAPVGLDSIISSAALSETAAQTTTTLGLATVQKILIALVILAATSFGTYEARKNLMKAKTSSGANASASPFAGLTESAIPGRYNWIESGRAPFSIVLYADHTFMNKDGTTFPTYRWDITPNAFVIRWAQNSNHFTRIEAAGIFTGGGANGSTVRMEKQPLEAPAKVTTPGAATDIIASIRLEAQGETDGLMPVNTGNGDGKIVAANVDGIPCYQLIRKSGRPAAYLYLQIGSDLKTTAIKSAWVTVEYFDGSSAGANDEWLLVQYDAPGEAYRTTERLALTGSQTWKEASFFVAAPLFQNRQNAGGDFRLCAVSSKLAVRSVKLVKGNSLK